MARSIDHIVIAVRDLARATEDYRSAGFTVVPGGEHASGDTHNALISFADGSYFELLAFREPDRPQDHRWWPRLARGEGLVDFALDADDLAADAAALRAADVHVDGPLDGGRVRPDGQQIAWRTLVLRDVGAPLPFVIQDDTPRALRVPGGPAAEHPLPATRVDGLTVVVTQLDRDAAAFARLIGTPGVPVPRGMAGVRAAHRFSLGDQWIELAEPDGSPSEIRDHLRKYGAGPYEVTIRGPEAAEPGGRLLPIATMHGARIRLGGPR